MSATLCSALVVNFMFWTGTGAGAVAFGALLDLTGAEWGGPVRAAANRFTALLPAAIVVYVVLLFGARALYPWIDHPTGSAWLRFGPFVVRDVVTLIALSAAAAWFAADRSTRAAVVFLIAYGVGVSVLAIDLIMSLVAPWGSTLFPAYVFTSAAYAAIAAVALTAAWTAPAPALTESRADDLGRLLCGFSLLWMYFVWSQFLVIWYGNLSDEVPYVMRIVYGWKGLASTIWTARFLIPLVAFVTPFGRRPLVVVIVSVIVLAGFWAEICLLVVAATEAAPSIVATVATTAALFAVFAGLLVFRRAHQPSTV